MNRQYYHWYPKVLNWYNNMTIKYKGTSETSLSFLTSLVFNILSWEIQFLLPTWDFSTFLNWIFFTCNWLWPYTSKPFLILNPVITVHLHARATSSPISIQNFWWLVSAQSLSFPERVHLLLSSLPNLDPHYLFFFLIFI